MKRVAISIIICSIVITQSVYAQILFSGKIDFTTGELPYSVSIGDFNGDGMINVATANDGSNSVPVFLNNAVFLTFVELISSAPQAPETFELAQNYPDPFNPAANIGYYAREPGIISLGIYYMLRRETAVPVNEYRSTGS